MVTQRGRDFLLKIGNGSGYETVAGLRSRKLSFNAQTIDITDGESAGRWRELLAGAGIQRASISASGLFKDASSDALIRSAFFAGEVKTFQILIPDFGTVTGPFQIAALDYAGEYNGEMRFEIALESAGAISFGSV
ncbi:phage major tail protein, TP901-1 family [Gellertiella hungarica]|uniref:TP901-1 family phage major tail protein n=1 Tax=Gellertiella hungarica TaxID=1572859 RepID=A0A7W6NLR9_9HYPH|nr:phage major tail protein, TP901-1 family [Gellertiella hungarica]MBB4065725.1 TP901-1 family phage major tail protein [Gellertiella hungarica]